MGNQVQTKDETETTTKIEYPKRWNVVIDNDDFTPADFVIQLLVEIFNHQLPSARKVTEQIHNEGRGIAGTYYKEVAEQKLQEAQIAVSTHGHPLNVYTETV